MEGGVAMDSIDLPPCQVESLGQKAEKSSEGETKNSIVDCLGDVEQLQVQRTISGTETYARST